MDQREGPRMDEYLILLPDDEEAWERLDDAGRERVYEQHREFSRRLEEGGHVVTGGAELMPSRTATTVRRVDGRTVTTAGPAGDSDLQLSGFYLVESSDPAALIDICALLAETSPVEVRPVARHDTEPGDGRAGQ